MGFWLREDVVGGDLGLGVLETVEALLLFFYNLLEGLDEFLLFGEELGDAFELGDGIGEFGVLRLLGGGGEGREEEEQ